MSAGRYGRLVRIRYKCSLRTARRERELDEARYEHVVRLSKDESAERRYNLALHMLGDAAEMDDWLYCQMADVIASDVSGQSEVS